MEDNQEELNSRLNKVKDKIDMSLKRLQSLKKQLDYLTKLIKKVEKQKETVVSPQNYGHFR